MKLRSNRKERLIVNGIGGKEEKLVNLDVILISAHNTNGRNCGVIELYVVPFICKPICDQQIELAQATYEHLISLNLADSTDGEANLKIDMLIGADFYWDYVSRDIIRGNGCGPVAVKTSFGWMLSGSMMGRDVTSSNLASAHVMSIGIEIDSEDERLDDMIQKFWTLEAINISDMDEQDVLGKFKETVKLKNGRYTVCLPWKETTNILPVM